MKIFILLFTFLVSLQASAALLIDVGGTYLSDDLSSSSTRSSTKYLYNLGLMLSFNKTFWGGWSYSGLSHTETVTTTVDYTSLDSGPYIKYQFGKNELFSVGANFNLLSRATFKSATSSETWEGTSFLLSFGVSPEVREGLHLGASINYYSASYTKKTVNSVESSTSNSKTWIFPMLNLTKRW